MRYTKNYKLKQPEADDYVLVEDFNENSDTVDGLIKKIESVIGDLENSEEKDSLIKLIEKLEKDKANMNHSHTDREIWVDENGQWELLRVTLTNKADLGKDGKVVPEQLPEVDLSGIENSITELESNALKLGETETTALDGYRGMIAFNHAKSKHADPNAITEERAIELIKKNNNSNITYSSGSNYSAVKINNVVICAVYDLESDITLPYGFRPPESFDYYPKSGSDDGRIHISNEGKISSPTTTSTSDNHAVIFRV